MDGRTKPQQRQGSEAPDAAGQLTVLDEAACRALLAEASVGRLVWHGAEGLSVVTVNYALNGRDILVRLGPWSQAGRECDRSAVAFHVDRTDAALRSGWSVLARGWARVDLMPAMHPGARVDVWPDGIRPISLRIGANRISGRRLGAAFRAGEPNGRPV